jgi:flagellar FliL protein
LRPVGRDSADRLEQEQRTMAASGAAAASGETAAAPAKKGKSKLLLLGGAGLLLLLGGGGAAAYLTGLLGDEAAAPADARHEAAPADGHGPAGEGQPGAAVAFVDMPDLIVNLQSDAPRLRYLKLRLSLEVADPPTAELVKQLMPRVMDSFQLYLRALSLSDVQGAVGMQRLKEELTARVNLAVEPASVNAVLLKEMLVQ